MAGRILVALGDERTARLDQLAERNGQSRSAMIRAAVDKLIDDQADNANLARRKDAIEAAFGAWKHRTDIGDAVEWQRRERASWTRPWDDNYEDVKAEFPDLFDEEDDRQRQIYLDMRAGRYADRTHSDV